MSEKVKLEEWEQELQDEEWEEDGELVMPSAGKTSVQSVRFSRDELQLIRDTAREAGVTTSMFIRQAAAQEVARWAESRGSIDAAGERTASDLEHAAAIVREMSKQLAKRSAKERSA